jgi:hypothetical protein
MNSIYLTNRYIDAVLENEQFSTCFELRHVM